MNHRGSIQNIKLIQAAIILVLHLKVITSDDLKLAINSY